MSKIEEAKEIIKTFIEMIKRETTDEEQLKKLEDAIAKYVESYLFDVLKDVGNDEYVAIYLRENGYKVTKD